MLNLGSSLLDSSEWEDYKSIMNDAHATFSQKKILWESFDVKINRYQEDIPGKTSTTELLVLLNYNYRRTWPINLASESGVDDEQSLQIMINKEYLRINNLLDENDNFIYNEVDDNFIIDGTKYKAFGDTPVSQMQDDDVFITIIVKRVQLDTGTKR